MDWGIKLRGAVLAALVVLAPGVRGDVLPADSGIREMATTDPQRARGLLARAVVRFREQGDAAFAAFNHPAEFVDAELYVYVLGTDGTFLASGGSSAALIGRKVTNMRDAFGTPFFYDKIGRAHV